MDHEVTSIKVAAVSHHSGSPATWLDEWDAFERLSQTRTKYLHWFLNAWIIAMGLAWAWQLVFVPKLHIVAGFLPFAVGLIARAMLSAGYVRATRVAFVVMGCLLVWCTHSLSMACDHQCSFVPY